MLDFLKERLTLGVCRYHIEYTLQDSSASIANRALQCLMLMVLHMQAVILISSAWPPEHLLASFVPSQPNHRLFRPLAHISISRLSFHFRLSTAVPFALPRLIAYCNRRYVFEFVADPKAFCRFGSPSPFSVLPHTHKTLDSLFSPQSPVSAIQVSNIVIPRQLILILFRQVQVLHEHCPESPRKIISRGNSLRSWSAATQSNVFFRGSGCQLVSAQAPTIMGSIAKQCSTWYAFWERE